MKSNSKRNLKGSHPESQLTLCSSTSLLYQSILTSMKNKIKEGTKAKNDSSDNLRKKSNNEATVYKCGCVVMPSKIQNNCSIEFPIKNKIKSGSPAVSASKVLHERMSTSGLKDSRSKNNSRKHLLKANKSMEMIKVNKTIDSSRAKSRRQQLIKQESELKKIMKKISTLREQYEALLKQSVRSSEKSSKEVVTYVPKEMIKNVPKIRTIQKPVEKIVYKIRKIPKELIKYKDIEFEVPDHREELVFVDPQPLPPIIKEIPIIREIQKQISVRNPQNQANKQLLQSKTQACRQLEILIQNSLKTIENLKVTMNIERQNQQTMRRIKSLQSLQQNTVRSVNPETSIVVQKSDASPIISKFQIEEGSSQKIQFGSVEQVSSRIIESTTEIRQDVRRPVITRITAEGRVIQSSYSPDPRQTLNPLPTSQILTRPTVVVRTVRPYCKKNCGDVCTCMTQLNIVTRQA